MFAYILIPCPTLRPRLCPNWSPQAFTCLRIQMVIRETFAHHVQLTLPIPTANFDAKLCDLCAMPSYTKLCQAMPSYAKLCQAMPSYAKLLLCPGDEVRSDMFLDHGPNVTNRFSVFLGTMAGTMAGTVIHYSSEGRRSLALLRRFVWRALWSKLNSLEHLGTLWGSKKTKRSSCSSSTRNWRPRIQTVPFSRMAKKNNGRI